MTRASPVVLQVSADIGTHALCLKDLQSHAGEAERWLYVTGRFVGGPGIRTRNLEGLGDDWLTLRNAALNGGEPGQRLIHDPAGYFANGCVALALRDIVSERDGPIDTLLVKRPLCAPVRLDASRLDRTGLERLVEAYISGDVWRLSVPDWALVVSALPPLLPPAL